MGEEGGHKTAGERERGDERRRPPAARLPSFHETARPPFHRAGQRCSARRQKEVELLGGVGDARWTLVTGGGGGEVVRRSNRRVKVRGEREFMVHSDMLLRDFKVKVRTYFVISLF